MTRRTCLATLACDPPNCEINEFAYKEVSWRADLTEPPEGFDKGRLTVSDRPGFGIRLNEKIVRQFAR